MSEAASTCPECYFQSAIGAVGRAEALSAQWASLTDPIAKMMRAELVSALSLPSAQHVHDYSEVCTRVCPANPWHDEGDTSSLPPARGAE